MIADRGYDHDKYRRELWRRGVTPRIARRPTEHGSALGRVRWAVERNGAYTRSEPKPRAQSKAAQTRDYRR